ncbi:MULTISPECIES: MFS transporter [Bacillus]|uniref:MFS transporter n=3 Tax=Bacillus pseudomycoides TaxID=64104 RepID=A0AAJ2DNG9_9BACI|nr:MULTISPECIES: MFS transporter [Bacillus]AIK40686.1 sugar (and other) transporter family protein [Bacillus pseudomycoides]AJI17020.1 sugar (and other) transporter family protein [Bacillus pseudomycoides]EEM05319.1 Permease of the major facilitator super [Bacillus pseudomycoides]EEM11040.1 Permease of the major facilitator super [Bacillus pseudomycoides]EEM16834.1 Permease of the major facilitator super [Bacillus pseudomycoides DSM 12442]
MDKYTLANHNISILFWVHFFGTISFLQAVMTLFYVERGLTPSNIFIVLMCWSGAVLIGEVPAGIFADRFSLKLSFITGACIKIISISILFFADNIWLFCLYSLLNGLSVTFFSGADEALIYESLKETNEQHLMDKAMGKIQSASFISMLIAVIFGSYFAKDLKEEQFFILITLGLLFHFVELILLLFIKNPAVEFEYNESAYSQVIEGIQVIRRAPQLLIMFLNISLVFIPASAVFDNYDQLLLKNAGVPVFAIGILYAVAAIGGYFASISIGWLTRKFSRIFLLNLSGALAVCGLLLAACFGNTLWSVLGAFIILRFVRAIRYPIYSQLSNDIIPSHVRATTISLLSVLDSVLDLIIFGTLSILAVYGLPVMFMGCTIIALIGTCLPIKGIREVPKNIES